MPLLASLVSACFGTLFAFFARYLGVRVATVAAAVATFLAINATFYAAVAVALTSVATAFPGGLVTTGIWMFVPDNAGVCLSAIVACDTAAALYRWNLENLHIASRTA